MDGKVFVGWPHGRKPTREEALAMARRLVEQMQAQRLLREALPPESEDEDRQIPVQPQGRASSTSG